MKKIEHPLFSLDIPDFFDRTVQESILFQAESELEPFKHQKKLLKVYLFKRDELNSTVYKGTTTEEKWEEYCLVYFKSEKVSREEETLSNYKVWKMLAKTDAFAYEQNYKISYFFGTFFLDNTYALHIEVMHESDVPGKLENWVGAVFQSIKIKGGEKERDNAFQLHQVETEKAEIDYQKRQAQKHVGQDELKQNKEYRGNIPADGKDYFKVGDFDFDFLYNDTNWQIGSQSKELYIALKAKINDFEKAREHELLDHYGVDGIVTLNIPGKGIHQNGVPTGIITFEEEKSNAPLFLHARSEGFDYALAFHGEVTFKEGWVIVSGEMTKSYHNRSFPIQIAKKFDAASLNWKDYQFTSMEETASANPEDVKHLSLQNTNFTKLPEAIFSYKNLECLIISSPSAYSNDEKLPLNEIQSAIGHLAKLKRVHINGAAIKKLPESISNLTDLEQLSLGNCVLEAIPAGVFKLPKLKYLWLGKNQLTEIPKEIDLPSLEVISLDGNQLKTLPATLAEQPKLNNIDLKNNPWVSLPQNFNTIKAIELSMEDKLRLLDFDYKGADGQGLVPWNDSLFYAAGDADLMPQINAVIAKNKLSDTSEALRSLVKKAIGFTHSGDEDYKAIGNNRFGGMPDLPEAMGYPEFYDDYNKVSHKYEFIGQINCTAIAHLQDYLPRKGMLYFFLETVHNLYGGNSNPCKVVYYEDETTLVSGQRFQFSENDYFEMMDGCYRPYKVSAKKMNSAPSLYASYVNTHLFLGAAEVLKDDDKLLDDLYDSFESPINQENTFQYAVNAHGFTQHEAPELQASLAKKGNPQDWMTLLVVTSAGDMQWGDAGDLFFVIHKSDLAKHDFSTVFVTMESS